jgi:transcriptional regulator with XRE-family HTH domain
MLDSLLERAGITKAELSRRLGITANAVSKWKGCAPQYVVAYLELLIEYNRHR